MTDLDAILALVPPAWLAALHEWAPAVLAALALTTATAHALLPLARRLELWAIGTSAAWDDGPARGLVVALEWLATASGWLLAWLPRLTAGPPAERRSEPAPRPRDSRPVDRPPPDSPGPGLALLLVALAGHATLASGCSSGPQLPVVTTPITITCSWSNGPDAGEMRDNDCMIDRSSAAPATATTGVRTETRDISPSVSVPIGSTP
jgi:hypothetical protein